MYTVKRQGSAASISADINALVGRRVPLAAAKALTFTAQRAQADIIAAMPGAFQGGASRYTLGATRIETASVGNLQARVAVKDRASSGGNLPENYLFPQVYGNARKAKRFEQSLRFSGVLPAGAYAVRGRDTPGSMLTAQGDIKASEIKRILAAVRNNASAKNAPYFAAGLPRPGARPASRPGAARRGMQPGIYRREGGPGSRQIVPVLVFLTKQPRYTPRLDFEGIARATAQRHFAATFARLLLKAGGPD